MNCLKGLLRAAGISLFLFGMLNAQTPDFSLVGFAAQDGGTTGGTGGTEVTVSTGQEIADAIDAKQDGEYSDGLIIKVDGTITQGNSPDSKINVKECSDISIIGVGTNGEFDGIGIKIWKASNIIVRNITVHHVSDGDGDCIGIEGPADHVWVDHCELYNDHIDDPDDTSNKDYYDGLLDAKGEVDYITYSWNYLYDSWKTMLVGSSDGDEYDRHITIHHNWMADCNSRLPLFRFGHGHIFNNYYNTNYSTGINCRMGAEIYIENNHFENMVNPIGFWYSDETGYWNLSGNEFINCTGEQPESSTTDYVPSYDYSSVLHPVGEVKSIVMQYAGVGVIDGSDDPQDTYTLSSSVAQGSGSIDNGSGTYTSGTSVTVTANPESGWSFDRWGGDVSSNDNPLTVTVNSDMNISAYFVEDANTSYTLSSSVAQGSGSIDNGSGTYTSGTSVTVTANPESGWYFDHWGGDVNSTDNPLTLTMDSDISITAHFTSTEQDDPQLNSFVTQPLTEAGFEQGATICL